MSESSREWSRDSWRKKPAQHQAAYADAEEVRNVTEKLSGLPPLVSAREIERLRSQLLDVADGKAFLLQGGDCAETASDCAPTTIAAKFMALRDMSRELSKTLGLRVVRMGRCAGQYAKPRSNSIEVRDGIALPSYAGDLINDAAFTEAARKHDPARMLLGYEHAALTLNYMRSLLDRDESFFTCHEGLHLEYESAQTHRDLSTGKTYDMTTHLPWIGDRTRSLDGAHVEFFRGVGNPIGIKVGPSVEVEELVNVIATLNPANERGKILLVTRLGKEHVRTTLPSIVDRIGASGHEVIYVCDPMHGNTRVTDTGAKIRMLDEMREEIVSTSQVLREHGALLQGLHVELAGDDVTECVGAGVSLKDLERNYASLCDPRLNPAQALKLARDTARELSRSASDTTQSRTF